MFKEMYREEKGLGQMTTFILLLPFLLLLIGLMVDYERARAVMGGLQTACDAAALAAASTAEVIAEEEIGVMPGDPPQVTVNMNWTVEIPPGDIPYNQARLLFHFNSSWFTPGSTGVEFDYDNDWEGTLFSRDSYLVRARVRVKTFFAGPMIRLFAGDDRYYEIPVSTEGVGQAILR